MNKYRLFLLISIITNSLQSMENTPTQNPTFEEQCKELVILNKTPWDATILDLTKLDLSNKNIKKLSSFIQKTLKLRALFFGGLPGHSNLVKVVDKAFKSKDRDLAELNLSHNRITLLPKGFGQLTSLTSLNLSHNKLKKLPSSLGKLINLKKLYLDHNDDLTILPKRMTRLTNLEILCLGDFTPSQLVRYGYGIRPEPKPAVLKCALETLPDGIENLPNLDADSKRDLQTLKAKFDRQKKYQEIKNSPVWLNIYKTALTDEQKDAIAADNYNKNLNLGRCTLRFFIQKVFEALNPEIQATLDINEFAAYMIVLREKVLSDKPILVTDINSTRARAIQRLTPEEKTTLSRTNFLKNRERAKDTVIEYTNYLMEELHHHKLFPEDITPVEYIEKCIQDKMEELDRAYA